MKIDFSKHPDGLVPAIVQDANTKCVLMLGYMNREAVTKTQETQQVTFFSRSKNRLWTKGEESGHVLTLIDMALDCDRDHSLMPYQSESIHDHSPPLLSKGGFWSD